MMYQGGSWIRTTSGVIQWAKGIKTRQDLYNKGIKGEYLGPSYNEYTGEGYITNYLPSGQTQKQFVGEIKKENYTWLKQWEDKAKQGGIENIPLTLSFEWVNGIYVFVRAMLGMQDRSISGRGLTPRDKFEAGLSGLQTVGMWTIPMKIQVTKGVTPETTFQQFSKLIKGKYSGQGYNSSQHMNIKWQDFKTNQLHLQLNTSNPFQDIQRAIQVTKEVTNEIED